MQIFDPISQFIFSVMYFLRIIYQDYFGQINVDFNNDVMLAVYMVAYVISIIFIIKLIISVIRWFFRI